MNLDILQHLTFVMRSKLNFKDRNHHFEQDDSLSPSRVTGA